MMRESESQSKSTQGGHRKRHPFVFALAAGVVLVAAAAGGWQVFSGNHPAEQKGEKPKKLATGTHRREAAAGRGETEQDASPSKSARSDLSSPPAPREPTGSPDRVKMLLGKIYPPERRAQMNQSVKEGLDSLKELRSVTESFRRTESESLPGTEDRAAESQDSSSIQKKGKGNEE
jgi:hypothetical protein